MNKKTKQNIAMFIMSLILIGFGFICGRITASDKDEEEGA